MKSLDIAVAGRNAGMGIAEVVVLSTSKLVNAAVKDSGFQKNYELNVLGIQRGKDSILDNLAEEKILAGDSLLVEGARTDIAKLHDERNDWMVVGQPTRPSSAQKLQSPEPS